MGIKNFFKKDELKLLWPFYVDALILSLFFIYPAFYIIYMRDIGLSLTQIGFLTSALALPFILFEIPTGAIADIFGRKFSTVLGIFLSGIVMISIMFFTNFYILLMIFFVWGAVGTLKSGAGEAWIVDLLKHEKRKELIHEYYVKIPSFYSIALLLSGIIGAFLVKKFGLGIIWPISGISVIFTSIFFLFGEEHFTRKKQHIKEHTHDLISHIKESLNYCMKNRNLLLMISAGLFGGLIINFSMDLTWYPFLQGLGFKNYWFGYLFSATCLVGIFVPYMIKPLVNRVGKYKDYLVIISSLMFILLFIVGFINSLFLSLAIFILYISAYDFFRPARNVLVQKFIPSKKRATILSIESMALSVVMIIGAPLAGFFADKIGPQNTIFMSSFILIPMIILYSKIKENKIK